MKRLSLSPKILSQIALIFVLFPITTSFQANNNVIAVPPENNPVKLVVHPEQVLCENFLGFGSHGDCFLNCSVNTRRGVNEADKKLVFARIRMMRPHVIRTFFAYQWWEPEERKQTRDGEYIKDYVDYVRFLKSINCKVNLTPWGDWFAYSSWMEPDPNSRMPAISKQKDLIRSLVDFLEYLRKDENLTNVCYLTLMNEPDNSGRKPKPEDFVAINRMLTEELVKRGMRQDIFVIGIDGSAWSETKPGEWFYEVLKAGGTDYFDGTAAHTYGQNLDCDTLVPWVASRVKALEGYDKPPKPLMITEFGCFGKTKGGVFTFSDNDKYEYGLFLARFAVISLRQKAANLLCWSLFDTYYDVLNKQETGLLRWKDECWKPRPGYFSWSLLTRYTKPGSKVINVVYDSNASESRVPAVALLSSTGELTFLAVNTRHEPIEITLNSGLDKNVKLDSFDFYRENLPTLGSEMIQSSRIYDISAGQDIKLNLPAESFVVLTNVDQKLRDCARQITEMEKRHTGGFVPDRALFIAPDADSAYQLSCIIQKKRPDFWVVTFDPAYENPVPLPTNFTLKHMVGAYINAYVIEPGRGYPEEIMTGLSLFKQNNLFMIRPIKTEIK